MARGRDILFDPPKITKAPWKLESEDIFEYPAGGNLFLLSDGIFYSSDGEKLFKKPLQPEGEEEVLEIANIKTLTSLGALAFDEDGHDLPTFHSMRKINGENTFPLGKEGLLHPLVSAYPLITDDPINPEGSIYGIDSEGNLYMHLVGGGPWRPLNNNTERFLFGDEGVMFINRDPEKEVDRISFSDGRGFFWSIKEDLSQDSKLRKSQKFVKLRNDFFFLGEDGSVFDIEENVFIFDSVKDLAGEGDTLALLTESGEIIVYQNKREILRESLATDYSKVLLSEGKLLLFDASSLAALDNDRKSSKQAEVFHFGRKKK